MHKDIVVLSNKKRKSAVDTRNGKTNVRPINFTNDDYVLRGTIQGKCGRKPTLKWFVPFRVVECSSDYILFIEGFVNREREEAHGRLLRFIRNSAFSVTEELQCHLMYQKGELLVIEKFTGIRSKGTSPA